ncbi:sugar ABC transporter permease [Streptomyces platensis]|uniref:sugar ABC transporter permease n=1 Tax=Streptomyces platensis TaxID=58346 RepID=UPI002E818A8F|nr:sugar ABC transporter permease [Streptomyces platensis]WUB84071.1 sugar ABC transporter permease [Streptomyces platensis]
MHETAHGTAREKGREQSHQPSRAATGRVPWADRAWAAVLERTGQTAAEVGPRFPLYADPETGIWKTTSRGSWTGGFWAGLLWLRALASGAPQDRSAAAACTRRLAHWIDQDTATRRLIFWYGTGFAAGPGGDSLAAGLRERAARSCLAAYDPERQLVPWGEAFGGPGMLARVDAVPGLVPLLAGLGTAGERAAYGHLTRHLTLSRSESPPRPAWQAGSDDGWTPCVEPAPGWSRTTPWLLLGLADGLHCLADGLNLRASGALWEAADRLTAPRLAPADRITAPLFTPAAWLTAPPLAPAAPLVPPAQEDQPSGPLDTSAAAIESVALLKLAALARATGRGGEADRLTTRARQILHRLCTGHLSARGALTDGCYDAARALAPRHELIWGDFFLAVGLALLTGRMEPFTT